MYLPRAKTANGTLFERSLNRYVLCASMIRALFFLIVASLFPFAPAQSQSLKSYERAADEAMQRHDYYTALQHYATVLDRKGDKMPLWWKYADAAQRYHALEQAEKALNKVRAADPERKDFPLADLRLAQVKKMKGAYAEALVLYDSFLTTAPDDARLAAQTERDDCLWALQTAQRTDSLPTIVHLGKTINSEFSDFAPVMLGDTLYFSSYRFDVKGGRSLPRQKTTRLLRSVAGARAKQPGRGFPDADSVHVVHTAFSTDGAFLIFNQCKNTEAGGIRCDLWITVLDRRGKWLKPMRLPEPVNMKGYTSTQPAIGFDSTLNAAVLYFASDRPGGQGGLDLWSVPLDTLWFCPCNRPLDGRKGMYLPDFEKPKPIAALNTPGNDGTPFFHEPTQTLFFSSDARRGYGGYDVYAAPLKADTFGAVRNLGQGVNSSYNDLYYFLKPDGYSGLLSSNRPGSFYLDPANKACCNDLFTVEWPKPKTPEAPEDPQPQPPPLTTVPPDKDTLPEDPGRVFEEFVGLPLFFDNDEPDPRTRRTSTRKNYEATVLTYLQHQEEYRTAFSTGLPKGKKEEAAEAIDAFFDNEVRQGYERLGQFAEVLKQRLDSGERVEVLIKGYTSPRAQTDYNLNLGKRRVSSVINYFDAYDGGAFKPYINDKTLVLAETSFGESTAAKGISDDIADRRNSVYHPAAARERRVEIVSIKAIKQ